tara:strand:- start:854 stop:1852 length:999 start_codon:yes stop_codon:yes gene_type:complete
MLAILSKKHFNLGVILIGLATTVLHVFSFDTATDTSLWRTSGPLALKLYNILGDQFFSNTITGFTFSMILITFQLVLVYRIMAKSKKLEKYNMQVTWIYAWLIHLFPEWSSLSPVLIATSLLLFVLDRIYRLVDFQKNNFLFNASSLLGIAFLFWHPTIVIILFLLIFLFQYNEINLKRVSILLLSFSIPVIWYNVYNTYSLEVSESLFNFNIFHIHELDRHILNNTQWASLSILLVYVTVGLLNAWSLSNQTSKNSRLFINSLLVLSIIVGLGFTLSINALIYSFPMTLFPASFFIILFLNNFKRSKHSELAHIILLLSILFNFAYEIISK